MSPAAAVSPIAAAASAATEAADIARIPAFRGFDFYAVEQRLGCHLQT
jgi:hypothetical protein